MRKQRIKKLGLPIPEFGHIEAYAVIVDLNQFTGMVRRAEEVGDGAAQFTRDALTLPIEEIEEEGGEVVAYMGDAFLAVIPEGEGVVRACFGIAKAVDRQCEYINDAQFRCEHLWSFAPGGPSVKIAIEYGRLDISTISSRFLGSHRLLIGTPINYAARIGSAGRGNRCVVGPQAAKRAFRSFTLDGPHEIKGKRGEPPYEHHFFSMGDIWIEGPRKKGKRTSWE